MTGGRFRCFQTPHRLLGNYAIVIIIIFVIVVTVYFIYYNRLIGGSVLVSITFSSHTAASFRRDGSHCCSVAGVVVLGAVVTAIAISHIVLIIAFNTLSGLQVNINTFCAIFV